jgi:dephospho-CoA kinase
MSDVIRLPKKVIIGLTGNIATGKSAVMRLAAARGALTIDADQVVHALLDIDTAVQATIEATFGKGIRGEDGRIDRAALGQIVFNDPNALRRLEEIVHPAVQQRILAHIQDSPAEVVMIEAIKLLEGKLRTLCHQIWVTRCPRARQLERLQICRGMDRETAVARIDAQNPQSEKVAQADVVIDTNGLMRDTHAQFELAWARLPAPAAVSFKPESATPPRLPRAAHTAAPAAETPRTAARPAGLAVRRARLSDAPSILLLIQQATQGAQPLKRADLLLALGQRSYFIGQIGSAISAVVGWHIDSLVSQIEEVYLYPLEAGVVTGAAILEEIERSARQHICDASVAFLPANAADALRQLFAEYGYAAAPPSGLPRTVQQIIAEKESPTALTLVKLLR